MAGCSAGVWQDDESKTVLQAGDEGAQLARSKAHLYKATIDDLRTLRDAANAQRLELLEQAAAHRKRATAALSSGAYSEVDQRAHARQYAEFAARLEREAEVCAERAAGYTKRMALLENKRQNRLRAADEYDRVRVTLP
jgi:hypothetical protein